MAEESGTFENMSDEEFEGEDGQIVSDSRQTPDEDTPAFEFDEEGNAPEAEPPTDEVPSMESPETEEGIPPEKIEGVRKKYGNDPQAIARAMAQLQQLYGRQSQELGEARQHPPAESETDVEDDDSDVYLEGEKINSLIQGAVRSVLAEEKQAWQEEQQRFQLQHKMATFMTENELDTGAMGTLVQYMTENNIGNLEKAHKLAVMEGVLPGKGKRQASPATMTRMPRQVSSRTSSGDAARPTNMADVLKNWDNLPDDKRMKYLKQLSG